MDVPTGQVHEPGQLHRYTGELCLDRNRLLISESVDADRLTEFDHRGCPIKPVS